MPAGAELPPAAGMPADGAVPAGAKTPTRAETPGAESPVRAETPPEAAIADEALMRLAIREAELAIAHDDVPVGAIVVDASGEVIARGHNERELRQDPSAHAEMIALRAAAEAIGHWRLLGTTLYVTLEPCAMCAGAIVLARVPRVVYGTTDPKAGAAGSVLDILAEPRLNHRPSVTAGVLQPECAALLKDFFAARR
ncbi:tRNA adenosine(34) deaminase TadA [Candidatus Solirubrobacter pratensis]|uniref:tRNA adenosine(34) deaminase TadA n=1 Tax=Candidatus Solirubrobacter pratensis TaxID=1298857 RepID=UPI001E2FD0F6|nr:tRNA adenosine(34) deaminase TadA [Candidatus Solirubrobacter pratensis]